LFGWGKFASTILNDAKMIIVQLTTEQLSSMMQNAVRSVFSERPKESAKPDTPRYLTRSEVAKMLRIDLSTLHLWTKQGKLVSYGIGNRVYYKQDEVEDALKQLNGIIKTKEGAR
jgi:excisionase family DNA binding protein